MLGKTLALPFFIYLVYEGWNVYSYCAAPTQNAFNAIKPEVDENQKMKFNVYLKQGNEERQLITSFEARNSWEDSAIPVDKFVIPNFKFPSKNTNSTVRVTLEATDPETNQVITEHTKVLSRMQVPPQEAANMRNLWEDPDGSLKAAKLAKEGPPNPRSTVPPTIEVGFVCEERGMDRQALIQRGFFSFITEENKFKLTPFVNTVVVPRDMYVPVSEEMDLEVRFHRVSFAYWNGQRLIQQSFQEAEEMYGLNEYDIDSFSQLISGPSPWKLIIVYAIALLHFIFEYMVIAADVSFWRSKTSFDGLSHHSIALNIGMKFISVLYVIEDGKTKLILYFVGARMLLEVWKFFKMMRAKNEPWQGDLEELRGMSNIEIRLMKILFVLLLPAVFAFAGYRLVTANFKGWYSFFILTLAATSQMFGFVVMMPQVFLNYRLKSVEHLPWKALTYQAMNTFIDDIFTLCIRMPEVVKYSVFRDDIVFVICMVQRHLYKKRRGEEITAAEHKKDDDKQEPEDNECLDGNKSEKKDKDESTAEGGHEGKETEKSNAKNPSSPKSVSSKDSKKGPTQRKNKGKKQQEEK